MKINKQWNHLDDYFSNKNVYSISYNSSIFIYCTKIAVEINK